MGEVGGVMKEVDATPVLTGRGAWQVMGTPYVNHRYANYVIQTIIISIGNYESFREHAT